MNYHSKDPIKRFGLVKVDIIIISLNVTCSCHDIAEKFLIWHLMTITYSKAVNLQSLLKVKCRVFI
jgi:hypothetical protein